MVLRGHVVNGVVVLEGGAKLPEGAVVKVEVVDVETPAASDDPVYRMGELAVPTGVPDLSVNIDHYLCGHPKAKDVQP